MKRESAVIMLLACGLIMPSLRGGEVRTWTSAKGSTIEAELTSFDGSRVTLRTTDDKRIAIGLESLSPEDQHHVRRATFKPKDVSVSFEENNSLGETVYTEKGDAPTPRQGDRLLFVDDSTWVVLDARCLGKEITGNAEWPDRRMTTPGLLVAVKFKVTNDSKNKGYVRSPKLIDAQERTFDLIDEVSYYAPVETFGPDIEDVTPGMTKTFYGIYEVPEGAKDLKFIAHTFDQYDFRGTFLPVGSKAMDLEVVSCP